MIPAASVSANQKREIPVRTRPLSGIGVGRTTSNALIRSDATSSSRSAPTAYRSRTLPARRNVSACGMGLLLASGRRCGVRDKGIESRDDGGHVTEERSVVEAGVELLERQPLGDGGIDRQEVSQRASLVSGAKGAALNDRVRLLARQPCLLDERDEHATARV